MLRPMILAGCLAIATSACAIEAVHPRPTDGEYVLTIIGLERGEASFSYRSGDVMAMLRNRDGAHVLGLFMVHHCGGPSAPVEWKANEFTVTLGPVEDCMVLENCELKGELTGVNKARGTIRVWLGDEERTGFFSLQTKKAYTDKAADGISDNVKRLVYRVRAQGLDDETLPEVWKLDEAALLQCIGLLAVPEDSYPAKLILDVRGVQCLSAARTGLLHENPKVRVEALRRLGGFEQPFTPQLRATLLQILRTEEHDSLWEEAARIACRHRDRMPDLVPLLVPGLRDQERRMAVTFLLMDFGTDAAAALPELNAWREELKQQRYQGNNIIVTHAIASIDPSQATDDVLIYALDQPCYSGGDSFTRLHAIYTELGQRESDDCRTAAKRFEEGDMFRRIVPQHYLEASASKSLAERLDALAFAGDAEAKRLVAAKLASDEIDQVFELAQSTSASSGSAVAALYVLAPLHPTEFVARFKKNKDERSVLARPLQQLGAQHCTPLIETSRILLHSEDAKSRLVALFVVAGLGDAAEPLLPAFVKLHASSGSDGAEWLMKGVAAGFVVCHADPEGADASTFAPIVADFLTLWNSQIDGAISIGAGVSGYEHRIEYREKAIAFLKAVDTDHARSALAAFEKSAHMKEHQADQERHDLE